MRAAKTNVAMLGLFMVVSSCSDPNSTSQPFAAKEVDPTTDGAWIDVDFDDLGVRRLYVVRRGERFFADGDIEIRERQIRSYGRDVAHPTRGTLGNGVSAGSGSVSRRWPKDANGDIAFPYAVDSDVPNQSRITSALAAWSSVTHVRAVLRTAANASQYPDYVQVRRVTDPGASVGGSSDVGRVGGVQYLDIPDGWDGIPIQHEVGHALGLFHEQQRQDRDWFVNVANLPPELAGNYDINGEVQGYYDFSSMMQYGSNTFNPPQMTDKCGGSVSWFGIISQGDVNAIQSMYYPDADPAGDVFVAMAANYRSQISCAFSGQRTEFAPFAKVHDFFGVGPDESLHLADADGDGRDDLIVFQHGHWGNGAYVALNRPGGFVATNQWQTYFCVAGEVCGVGDIDGDLGADAIAFQHGANGGQDVWVARSNKSNGFGGAYRAAVGFCGNSSDVCGLGDVDGDGRVDIIQIRSNVITVAFARWSGSQWVFSAPAAAGTLSWVANPSDVIVKIGRANADAYSDLILFRRADFSGSGYHAELHAGNAARTFATTPFTTIDFPTLPMTGPIGSGGEFGDVDGDGAPDMVVFFYYYDGSFIARGGHWVYINNGSGAFSRRDTVLDPALPPHCVNGGTCLLGKINPDRAMDLVGFHR